MTSYLFTLYDNFGAISYCSEIEPNTAGNS